MEILAQIFEIIINWIYGFTGDYGVTIVIITIAIRTCMVPFNIRQRKKMEQQKEIAKEIESIKAAYGKNKEKLNSELQKVYQKNPIGMGNCILRIWNCRRLHYRQF